MSGHDAKFIEVMARQVGDTGLKNFDLYLIGEALLNYVATVNYMGHASPGSLLDYLPEPTENEHVSAHILRDFTAWTSGRKDMAPGCEDRLRDAMDHFGWMLEVGRKAERILFPDAAEAELADGAA